MSPSGAAASFRVYEPLAAFPEQIRERYALTDGSVPSRVDVASRERAAMTRAAIRPTLKIPPSWEEAYLLVEDGLTKACPWDLQVRVWAAYEEMAATLPAMIAESFVPPREAVAAAAGLAALRAEGGRAALAHVQTSTWAVPLRWFLAFEPGERHVVAEPGPGGARELTYRTSMAAARRRLSRALAVIRRTIPDGGVAAEVTGLARWLEDFHPFSTLELDYGDLARLMDAESLRSDTSAADAAEALASLAEGDGDGAARAYVRALVRWRELAGTAVAN